MDLELNLRPKAHSFPTAAVIRVGCYPYDCGTEVAVL